MGLYKGLTLQEGSAEASPSEDLHLIQRLARGR